MKSLTPLKLAIALSGRTQTAVADEIGMDVVQFNKIVNGHRTPNVAVAVRIAEALGRPVESLWPGQGTTADHLSGLLTPSTEDKAA